MQIIIRGSGFPHWVIAAKIKTKNNFAGLAPLARYFLLLRQKESTAVSRAKCNTNRLKVKLLHAKNL
ncbi:hypothetical protein [Aquitalea sp. FJL05]|uniref:hypothetical protein n=1 Tax=Aquitalea sp. FJL05 TaxID=2153366 RepID=UPI001F1D08EF|nr:hypothetical protein [Aquitalea sp. FJL05]